MATHIDESVGKRTISDDISGRIYSVEWRCHHCGKWVNDNDTDLVWANPKTGERNKGSAGARPFHLDCAPEERG